MAVPSTIDRYIVARPHYADLIALVAGCVFPLSFSPFHFWPLGLLSLAALMLTVSPVGVSALRGSLRFYLFAVGLYGVGASWIYVSIADHGGASPALAVFLVALLVLAFSLLSWIHGYLFLRFVRPVPAGLTVGFAITWLLREWTFTWFLTGFPWLLIGYGHLDTALAGFVPLVGVLGLGFVIALQAAVIAVAVRNTAPAAIKLVGVVVIGAWLAGWALGRVPFVSPLGKPLTVSVVQGNIDQETKWNRSQVGPIIDTYLGLTNPDWGSDLIVWPEASITLFRENATSLLGVLDQRANESGSALIMGLPDRGPDLEFWNTAIVLGEGEGRYIKRRLVPFGEYVPLENLLRGTIALFDLPMSRNRPGPWQQPHLKVRDLNVSMSICYEIVYPDLVRGAGQSDLLVTISNDTWFGRSIGPYQHMQMARARAMENGRYQIRATNNGITAIVDHEGVVLGRLPRFEPGVLRGEVRRVSGQTPWSQLGSAPFILLAGMVLALMLLSRHVSAGGIR